MTRIWGNRNHALPLKARAPIRFGILPATLISISLAAFPNVSVQALELTAFVNANVIPMDNERILEAYTVVVGAEDIIEIGPTSDVEVPSGAEIIDARGMFLMPGLADMHAHLNIDPNPDFMLLFLAEGVTTIRNLNALPSHLKWRNQVLRGERTGPTIYTSGPVIVGPPEQTTVWIFRLLVVVGIFSIGAIALALLWFFQRQRGRDTDNLSIKSALFPGCIAIVLLSIVLLGTKAIPLNTYTSLRYPFAYVPDTEARARAEVRRQVEAGYDLIKVYDWMPQDQYLGAIDEARNLGIYVVGHVDHGIEAAFAAGLRESVHVDEFLDEHLIGEISPRHFEPLSINLELIPQSVASVASNDAIVLSNLVTDVITYEYLEEGPEYFDRPEFDRIRPEKIQQWLNSRIVTWQGQQDWRRNTLQPFYKSMIRALHAKGVPILTGTDTGTEGALPMHIHREIELLVDAGFSPFEALSAATKNARLSINRMGMDDIFGEIAVGYRADIIMLAENPLEDVRATRQRLGVMSRGRWYTQNELDRLVSEVVASYQSLQN
jgi:imidazolonepropionase-like amidohydrolase